MTVVVVFEDLLVAVSDVLITSDQPGNHIILPSTGNTKYLKPSLSLSPTRMVRKYITFTAQAGEGTLLVAGNVSHIQQFAKNLTDIAQGKRDLPSQLSELRNGSPGEIADAAAKITESEGFSEFEVIGTTGNQAYARTFDVSQILIDLPYFGKVRAIGSGANDVVNWLRVRGDHWVASGLHEGDIERRRMHVLQLLPAILLEEDTLITLRTISKGVGGYYESYLMGEGKLIPIDSVLTLFANVVGKSRDYEIEISRFFFHLYVKDCLVVISMFDLPKTIRRGLPLKCRLDSIELFQIYPMFGNAKKPNWTVNLVAKKAAAAKHIRLSMSRIFPDGSRVVKRFFQDGSDSNRRLIDLKVSNGNLVVTLNEKGFDHFASKIPNSGNNSSILNVGDGI